MTQNNRPAVRFVRMLETARAAAADNPSLALEYEAGQVYQLDKSTADSFVRRGLCQLGKVVETTISDASGVNVAAFEFVPDDEDAVEPAALPAAEPAKPVPVVTPQPVHVPNAPDGGASGSPDESANGSTGADLPAPSKKERRGKFKANSDSPQRS